MERPGPERLGDLDLLRLLAILLVVASHIVPGGPKGSPSAHALLLMGILGNGVFFLISGYLLQRGYPSITTAADARHFFNRRAWRIVPLYLVAVIPNLLVLADPGAAISATDLVATLLALQMVLYPAYVSVLALWFIGMIAIFYLCYPLLTYRRPSWRAILLRGAGLFVVMAVIKVTTGLLGGGVFEYFPVFVLGVAAGSIGFLQADAFRSWRRAIAVAAVPAVGVAFLGFTDVGVLEAGGRLSLAVAGTVGAVVGLRLLAIGCFVVLVREAYAALSPWSDRTRALVLAGATASYAVYLFHKPFLAVVAIPLHGASAYAEFAGLALTIPILFVLCFYLQKASDRLAAPYRSR